jgi:DNA-binding beta-propeller fold protein YncE
MFSTNSVLKINRLLVGILCLYLTSCTPEDSIPTTATDLTKGVYVINEGTTIGTLSIYNRTTATVQNDVFEKANGGSTIGNSFQSMSFVNSYAYFVSSKSNKIVISDSKSFTISKTITGLDQPRNIFFGGKRAFIPQWGSDGLTGSIQVIDTTTSAIVKNIPTGKGPEKMAFINNLLWVINSGGAGKDSTINQIDIINNADTLVRTMTVPIGPNSLITDANNETWVLCGGYADRSGNGKLLKIKDNKIELSFDVPKLASNLIIDKGGFNLYFIAEGKIWQKDILNFGKTPPSVFGGIKKTFDNLTAIGVDTDTENFYCADALDSKSSGTIYIFDKTTFAEKNNFKVGIKPIRFIFR